MTGRLLTAVIFSIISLNCYPQESSFIVLGDIHYDLLEDHDMAWLGTKPDDLRQVTKEYTVSTEKHWDDFMAILKERIRTTNPEIKAVVQAGDLSEGLAGTPGKAMQMASNVIKAVDDAKLGVPWIIAKGNHDITGPGSVEAFSRFYVPAFRKYTGNNNIRNASYSYRSGNVQFTCIDPWDKENDMIEFLEKELSSSDAKFKFVVVHEPVIPVTERCWHLLRREPGRRQRLLEVIAKNKAIVLTAHLHKYSVVSRTTSYGPIVQVMTVSVIRDRNYTKPDKVITKYGSSIAEALPEWEPATLEARKKMLADEAAYVTYYKQSDLPGYSLIRINEKKNSVILEYYAAFGKKPFDKVNLSALFNRN